MVINIFIYTLTFLFLMGQTQLILEIIEVEIGIYQRKGFPIFHLPLSKDPKYYRTTITVTLFVNQQVSKPGFNPNSLQVLV